MAANQQRRRRASAGPAERDLARRPTRGPAASAASSISPDSRVSRITSARGACESAVQHRGAAERERERRGDVDARDAANAIGTEEPASQLRHLSGARR